MELDMKKWVNNASHYLSKVERKTLLWTNSSPTSNFAAQTVEIDLSNYDAVDIETYLTANGMTSIRRTAVGYQGEAGGLGSGGDRYTRNANVTTSGIAFTVGKQNGTDNAGAAIPYKIYGIKIGSGTEDIEGRGTSDYNLLIHKPSINGVTLVEGLSSDDLNIGDTSHEEMSQAEFDILPEIEKNDGTVYFITDGISKNIFLDDNTPIGMIAPYGGTVDPSYWLICDGRAISRIAYSELFLVIGTTYGAGDGSTTFNIPDLRGRIAQGAGTLGSETYSIGDEVDAGLPNIEGRALLQPTVSGNNTVVSASGAIKTATESIFSDGVSGALEISGSSITSAYRSPINFNASNSNSIYGNSTTVQPNTTITNYIIKAKSALSENQSQLDFFYPVGSCYETSDSTFNPNIKWGGTWELKTISDNYILEEGTSGIWTYRKWTSGIAECWGTRTYTTTSWNAWGSVYEGITSSYQENYPSNLFVERPHNVASLKGNGAGLWLEVYNIGDKDKTDGYVAVRPSSASQLTIPIAIYAKGLWKTYAAPNTSYKWHRVN